MYQPSNLVPSAMDNQQLSRLDGVAPTLGEMLPHERHLMPRNIGDSKKNSSFLQLVDRANEAMGVTRGNAPVMNADGLISTNNLENELSDNMLPSMTMSGQVPDQRLSGMPRPQQQVLNLQGASWEKATLAQALGLPPLIANMPIVSQVLACLVNTNVNPKSVTPSRSRKRQDYNCGKCGKRKKGHICEHRDLSEAQPAPKRRKYKPLQPFLYENGDINSQNALMNLNKLGIENVFVSLHITEADGQNYEVTAAYQQTAFHQPTYIGRLSPEYKELVKPAIHDKTMQKVGLNPLTRVTLDNGQSIWTAQLNIFRNQSWHTKKLVEKYFSSASRGQANEPLPPPSTTRPKPRRGVAPQIPNNSM